jgi:predicted nucleic acid-binding protein
VRYVGDASILLAFVLDDEQDARVDQLVVALGSDAVCLPPIWYAEVLNGLIQAKRRGRVTERSFVQGLAFFDRMPIEIDAAKPDMLAIHALAGAHRLSAYDAIYLELAVRKRLPLATNDKALAKAAASLGVSTV